MRGVTRREDVKPSVVLQEVQTLSAGLAGTEKLIKQAWVNILPDTIRLILLADEKSSLESQVKIADKMFEVLPKTKLEIAAVNNPSAKTTSTGSNVIAESAASSTLAGGEAQLLTSVCAALSTLASQVAAVQAKLDSRQNYHRNNHRHNNSRFRSRSRSQHRHRSPKPEKESELQPEFFHDLCWYHYTFGEKARSCADGCLRNKSGNNEK